MYLDTGTLYVFSVSQTKSDCEATGEQIFERIPIFGSSSIAAVDAVAFMISILPVFGNMLLLLVLHTALYKGLSYSA